MRFVDASVFVYAYLKPRGNIPPELQRVKADAREIVKRISAGEEVTTTLIHVSEVSNILESRMKLADAIDVTSTLLSLPNVLVVEPSKGQYEAAVEEARQSEVGVNDALAWLMMKETDVTEAYSFDRDFDKFHVKRVVA